jgi:vitamin B12 transporter
VIIGIRLAVIAMLGVVIGEAIADEPATQLDPVVVTATKTPRPAATVGASITIIDEDDIRLRQSTEIVDLLPSVPGLRLVEQGGRGGLAFLEPRGAGFTFTQVLVDGVKFNDAGGVMNFAGLSLVNFDRIEILRGPQSGLYGADAAGAVIQFFTRRGDGPMRSEVWAGAGNRETFEETGTLAGSIGPLGLSFGVHRVDTAGDRIHSEFTSTTVSARADVGRPDDVELTLSLRYVDSHVDIPVLVGGDRFVPLDPHQFVDQERLLVSARVGHWLRPGWKQTLQLGYVRHGADIVDPFDAGLDFAAVRATPLEQRYSADYFWTITLPNIADIGFLLTIGAAYERETGEQRVVIGAPISAVRELAVARETYSGYAQLQTEWRKRLFLTGGFRVDQSSVFGTAVTPRVAVVAIVPVTETRLRSAYGEGIRAPSFIQLFGDGVGFINGNRDLRPERSRSWEAGVDQPFGTRAHLSATYFNARLDDLVVSIPGGVPGSFNVGSATARGVEVSAKAYLTDWMALTGAYTYLRTEILENRGIAVAEVPKGASLLRQPTHWGSLSAEVNWWRFSGSLTGIFVGEREDFNAVVSPDRRVRLAPYARLDAAVSYELVRSWGWLESLEVFGRARNLTDEAYEDIHGFSSAGVSYLGGIRARF